MQKCTVSEIRDRQMALRIAEVDTTTRLEISYIFDSLFLGTRHDL